MKETVVFIEILRIIAAFAVVMIHVTFQGYLNFANKSDLSYLYLYNLCSLCVPIFVMITGVFSLDGNKKFKIARAYRMLYILGVYGTCFALMELIFTKKEISIEIFIEALINVISGKSWAHLWYLYMLIGLYLCMPLIRAFYLNSSIKEKQIMIITLFIFNSLVPFLKSSFNLEIGFNIPIAGIYVFYLMIGRYIYESSIDSNKWIELLFVISILIVITCAALGTGLTYEKPVTVVYSTTLFAVMKKNNSKMFNIYNHGGNLVSNTTFGIYIIHMVFLNFIYKYLGISPYKLDNPVILWIGLSVLVFAVSCLTVAFIKKLHLINSICKL